VPEGALRDARSGDNHDNGGRRAGRWRSRLITIGLLLAVIISGIAVYNSRQQWREMYMSVINR
jgi:hypothetical protein